jgi:uncharacterized protein (DUF4213/DUF364 family)
MKKITFDTLRYGKDVSNFNVESVVVGIRYTGVQLSNGSLGVAYTLLDNSNKKLAHNQYLKEQFLSKKDLNALIDNCTSSISIFRSIGVAALNAYSQTNFPFIQNMEKSILDILTENPSIKIGMIGNIYPMMKSIMKKGISLKILDKYDPPQKSQLITPVTRIKDLTDITHLVVSGSAIVFPTFGQILDHLKTIPGEKVFLGPTAQILPQVAFKYGFTIIGSSKINEAKETIHTIMEGGGYRAFKQYTEKYSYKDES